MIYGDIYINMIYGWKNGWRPVHLRRRKPKTQCWSMVLALWRLVYLDEIQQAVTVTRDDTRLTASSSCCQVDSEILRIHAMKDRALLAALQVPWQSEVLIEEHCPLRLGDPKSVQNCACCILKCQYMSFYPHIPLLKLGRFMYCIQFAHLEIEVPAKQFPVSQISRSRHFWHHGAPPRIWAARTALKK